MKKLLAIALTALMMVCAVVPAFADEATPAYETLPEIFEDADVQYIPEEAISDSEFVWSADTAYCWSAGELSVGQDVPVDQAGLWIRREFVYDFTFTSAEAGPYSFAVFAVNKTTDNSGKNVLTSTKAGAFNFTLKNEDGEVLGTYKLTEVQPAEVHSMLYYVIAEDVVLEEDTNYTFSVSLAADTETTLINLYYVNTEAPAADDGDDAADDTDAPAADDTDAPAADDNDAPSTPTAPATFDASLIALAAAGVSAAAAAVVSKKRR